MTGGDLRAPEGRAASRLDRLVAGAVAAAGRREAALPSREIERRAMAAEPRGREFAAALSRPGRLNVIAECKRQSPSRGVLRADYDAAALAAAYERGGAAVVSVLTDAEGFGGSLDDLAAARAAVGLPLLRKDFVVTEYQLLEARAFGADAVLLIVAALDRPRLGELLARAGALGLAALVEVHDEAELAVALDLGARLVGVNCRDLRTFDVNVATTERLAPLLPQETVAVAESGIRSPEQAARLAAMGYRAFLVGEAFVTSADPGSTLAAWLAEAAR